ncbi:14128_t:CDS:2 [Funneliformis geosporum]|uniref:77_t:CDS:1 n=1 Tax=Funneliformis geosporum TaxID=1117311 RepID=A0A9W4SK83_9GLOM|nr:14128_t:CDS:2 [Funneliformis geosporum]CAI2172557.1 77_t:CDS:2 [Funneliformis geosporum]
MSSKTTIVPSKGIETPRGVIFKLAIHTLMMIFLPLSTYYYTSNHYFEGENKATFAALAAAGIANLVVFSFIVTAALEDSGDVQQTKRDKKE